MSVEITHAGELKGNQWKTELFQPDPKVWEKIQEDILEIQLESFPNSTIPWDTKNYFTNPTNIVVLLKNQQNRIIGFTVAEPHVNRLHRIRQALENHLVSSDDYPYPTNKDLENAKQGVSVSNDYH